MCLFAVLQNLTRGFGTSGHFTFECKNARPYVSRPSRTQQLEKPKLLSKLQAAGAPSVEVPEEFKKKCVVLCWLLLSFSFLSVGQQTKITIRTD